MLIGIYSPYLATLTGGEKYIFTAASCLSKKHKVAIFWDDKSILEKASKKFNLDLSHVKIEEDIFSKGSTISRIIKTLKYDRIIYLSDGSIPIVGAKKLYIHFQFPVQWLDTSSIIFKFKKSRISKILCNSNFTKKFIDQKLKVNSFVLFPPADTNKNKISKKENIILTVGRYSSLHNGTDFKKLNVIVDAFKKFQKKRLKGWRLVIVTSVNRDMEEKFQEFENNINSGFIEIVKNAPFSEIISEYKRAKIYWHAAGFGEDLVKYPERAEHFGISTVEAMSYGAVPIVINAGGQKEIVHNEEDGFLWETVDELIDDTHKIATDEKLLKKISNNAFESSHNFSKERFCEELNHLI